MASSKKASELVLLEKYRVAIENAANQPVISQKLAEIGFTADRIKQGKAIFDETRQAYDSNKTEDNETLEAKQKFDLLLKQVNETYGRHRKKAKVIFRNDPVTLSKLELTGAKPRAYVEILDTLTKFYAAALADSAIIDRLRSIAISPEQLAQAQQAIQDLKTSRSDYLREVGESQQATKIKDEAFRKISRWMSDFYAYARIALEDSPQLLEALGITVR